MSKENEVLLLDDNKQYVVVDKIDFESNNYIYLISLENPQDYIFGKIDGPKIEVVDNQELLGKLVLEFAEANK